MKVLTIGGATQDIFLHCNQINDLTITKETSSINYLLFASNEKIELDQLTYKTGGGATNSATSFKRLGFEAMCCCSLGNDDRGSMIKAKLINEGIDVQSVYHSDQPTGTSFILSTNKPKTKQTLLVFRGANYSLNSSMIPYKKIQTMDQLYITSLSGLSSELLPEITAYAHQYNIPVAVNPGSSQLSSGARTLKESLKFIDTLILNSSEAKMLMISLIESSSDHKEALQSNQKPQNCASELNDEHPYLINTPIFYKNLSFSIRNFFKEILTVGPKVVIITNGCNGVYVATHNEILFHPSLKINVVDTVGAGDAFGSCFVAHMRQGESIEKSLEYGILNSAHVLKFVGAKEGLCKTAQLKEMAKQLPKGLLQRFIL